MLRLNENNCKRLKSLFEDTKSYSGTAELYESLQQDLQHTLYPYLSELTGISYDNLDDNQSLCDYFCWAKATSRVYDAMKFQVDDDKYALCQLLRHRFEYAGEKITPDMYFTRSL